MGIPAEEIRRRVIKHARARTAATRRRRNETHAQHAARLRGVQRAHESAARSASSSAVRRRHEAAAAEIEEPAGEAEYRAAQQEIRSGSTSATDQPWPAALFLFAGSGITLWLLLSGHWKPAAEALGWAKAPKKTTTKASKK